MDFQERYEFNPKTDLLGKGGFSKVYKATDTLLERTVALKFFTGTVSDKYQVLNEIKKVIRFEHPNLCKYYDVALLTNKNVFGETERIEVGIMEYIDAGDFKTYIRKHPEQADKLLIDVLKGLAYLHRHGIAHRDLKPQNILIKIDEGEPVSKITDFGISKLIDADDANSSALLGTIEYMAPEQFNPKKYGLNGRITTNLDLWSFGLLVYEAVCHESFFGSRSGGISAEQVMANILSEASLAKADTLPPKYKEIVKRCLVKQAADRVQNALELIPLFENKMPVVVPAPTHPEPEREEATAQVTQVIEPESPLADEAEPGNDPQQSTADQTQVIDLRPETTTEETQVIEEMWDAGGETQALESIQDTTGHTQVIDIAPETTTEETEETEVVEPMSAETAEVTQVIEPAAGVEDEQTQAIVINEATPDVNDRVVRPLTDDGKRPTPEKTSRKPLQKAMLLAAAAVFLILLFLFFSRDIAPEESKDLSASAKPVQPDNQRAGLEARNKNNAVPVDTIVQQVDSAALPKKDTAKTSREETVKDTGTIAKKNDTEPKKDALVAVTFTINKAGYLHIDGKNYGKIEKEGRKTIKLAPGKHRLLMEDAESGTIKKASLHVSKGMAKTHPLSF